MYIIYFPVILLLGMYMCQTCNLFFFKFLLKIWFSIKKVKMANFEGAKAKMMNESGQLLWVCRRNGTWWPSQILSLDQVPESYMSSRNSGTPVKLLGKENAIM